MSNLATCTCGYQVQLPNAHSGTPRHCPLCGKALAPGEAHVTTTPAPFAPSAPLLLDDEGTTSPPVQRRRRRRKRAGASRPRKLNRLLPAISLDGTILGLTVSRWLIIVSVILALVILAWLLVPELGFGPYYTVERFADLPATTDLKTSQAGAGIIVHTHRTPAGSIQERIETSRTILDLTGGLFHLEQPEVKRTSTFHQGGRQVVCEMEWVRHQGIVSVKCDGRPVPRGLWSRLWDVDQ